MGGRGKGESRGSGICGSTGGGGEAGAGDEGSEGGGRGKGETFGNVIGGGAGLLGSFFAPGLVGFGAVGFLGPVGESGESL